METSSEGSGKLPGSKASGHLSSPPRVVSLPSPHPQGPPALKPVHRFIPTSWKNLFQRRQRRPWAEHPVFAYLPNSFRISPPTSPCAEHLSHGAQEGSRGDDEDSGSCGDCKETPSASTTPTRSGKTMTVATSQGGLSSGPPSYREKLEAYDQKFSYMKSWPGLLRFLGGLELLLGGMVFACTAAYIQKDYQWTELYGGGLPLYPGGYGYNYYRPMTPFVLVVTSLAWLVTVILLGLGVTMYYRTILLGSHWWPLTEFGLNLLMFLFYMAATIAYVDDVNRGGLCYSIFAQNPLIVALCRVEGGQVAAIAFLFINTLLYLAGGLVSLKMRKHRVARKEAVDVKPIFLEVVPKQGPPTPSRAFPSGKVPKHVEFSEEGEAPKTLNYAIPTGHKPKPHVVPDYVMKYPAIRSPEDQQRYKAVFNDQYAEYKELHREVQVVLQRFKELDTLMSRLPQHPQSKMEKARLSAVWKEYESKRKDPSFLEKQERCAYLKAKLSHLKDQIQAFNREASECSAYF